MMAGNWDDEDDVGLDDDYFEPQYATEPAEYATDDAEDPEPITVTVTNPPGTVSVTVLIDGCPRQIELAPRVATDMTESELVEEILVISRLARQNAQAGQHLFVAGALQRLGHDPASTRGFLEDVLGLPSAETALTDKAQIFAIRYTSDED
jgi:hypothetical protein